MQMSALDPSPVVCLSPRRPRVSRFLLVPATGSALPLAVTGRVARCSGSNTSLTILHIVCRIALVVEWLASARQPGGYEMNTMV